MTLYKVEKTSHIWHSLFIKSRINKNGVIVEVAPGHEPKIGNALALLGFRGTIFLIEPDEKTACDIEKTYRDILPQAKIKKIVKSLQSIEVGIDIPRVVDVLVASHPFDDMVISYIINDTSLFIRERKDGENLSNSIKKLYNRITEKDYEAGIKNTVKTWKKFIKELKPNYFIASQYPSHTLIKKGLMKRQNSGFTVLEQLKSFYKNSLKEQHQNQLFGYKGNPKWWIIVKKPSSDLNYKLEQKPIATQRLGKSIFVPQLSKRLSPEKYEIAYINNKYFRNLGLNNISKQIQNFAIEVDNKKSLLSKKIITYADRQKDKTGIGLSGNQGSGRAVYYGDSFNVLGVGKTTLCKSTIPSHSTGRLELVGAMRRMILSRWFNYFTQKAPIHPALIVLKETAKFKWNPNPIHLALLVRIDNGSLDRPSHVEYSPKIYVDFEKTLTEYAKLDAEYFVYKMILGAWSTSNYSLNGHVIDLESASFVKYRGPYNTSSAKYPHNLFGYEGFGFLRILGQLADIKNIKDQTLENQFYKERSHHLAYCFLLLLGIKDIMAINFLSKHQNYVIDLANRFEVLAKKIALPKSSLNLYIEIPDNEDPSLLDMANLFRNLPKLYNGPNAEATALKYLIRRDALLRVILNKKLNGHSNPGNIFIHDQAVINPERLSNFLHEIKRFVHSVFELLALLDKERSFSNNSEWEYRLITMNHNLPTMFELNNTLKSLAEAYRIGKINSKVLGKEIEKLCQLPHLNNTINPIFYAKNNKNPSVQQVSATLLVS